MDRDQTIKYLSGLSITQALWWFIENVNECDPARSDIFFYLRARVRNSKE